MFFRIHLNPLALDGPSNMLFWRDLILDFKFRDEVEFERVIEKVFAEHFNAGMSPSNVALNVFSKSPVFQLKHLKDPEQVLPHSVNTPMVAWRRVTMKAYYSSASKQVTLFSGIALITTTAHANVL